MTNRIDFSLSLLEIPIAEPARGFGHQLLFAESQIDIRRVPVNEFPGTNEIRFLPSGVFGAVAE